MKGKGIPMQSAYYRNNSANLLQKGRYIRRAAEEVLGEIDNSTIEELRTKLPKRISFAMQCNYFIKIDEEIATSRDKLTDVDILAFTREELTSFEEEKDEIEGEEEPLECPACFQVDKAVKTLQQSWQRENVLPQRNKAR